MWSWELFLKDCNFIYEFVKYALNMLEINYKYQITSPAEDDLCIFGHMRSF